MLEVLNIVIQGLLGYLFACVTETKIILLEGVFSTEYNSKILTGIKYVFFGLLVGSFVFHWIIKKKAASKLHEVQYSNICHNIFVSLFRNEADPEKYRVTLFRLDASDKAKPILISCGRYQKVNPPKMTCLTFSSGEGCAGAAYQIEQIVHKEIDPYNESNPDKYYNESKEKLNLCNKKAKKMNIKTASFLAIPVFCYERKTIWGVLCIDCTVKGRLNINLVQKIEAKLEIFSSFFNEGSL